MKHFRTIATLVLLLSMAASGGVFFHRLNEQVEFCKAEPSNSSALPYSDAAVLSYDGLNACFSNNPEHWYSRLIPTFFYNTNWSLGGEIQANVDMLSVPGVDKETIVGDLRRRIDALRYYWDDSASPPGYNSTPFGTFETGDIYYDDNAWIALSLLDAYHILKDPWYLKRAQEIFLLLEDGADRTKHLPASGGVLWTQRKDNLYTATVSTASSAQVAVRLYLLSQDDRYLKFAKVNFEWVLRRLTADNGLFADGVEKDGRTEHTQWSYNQGLMIGDGVLLFQATGERRYLDVAIGIAQASLKHFKANVLWQQMPIFNATFFKSLMLLDEVVPDLHYRELMTRYASRMLAHVDFDNGIFLQDRYPRSLDQAAAVQMFALMSKYS